MTHNEPRGTLSVIYTGRYGYTTPDGHWDIGKSGTGLWLYQRDDFEGEGWKLGTAHTVADAIEEIDTAELENAG